MDLNKAKATPISRVFLIGIVTTIILVASNFYVVQQIFSVQKVDSKLILQVDRQGTLSQKIIKEVYLPKKDENTLPKLKREVEVWTKIQVSLQNRDNVSEEVNLLFDRIKPHQEAISNVILNAESLDDLSASIDLIMRNEEQFLPLVDEIVSVLRAESTDRMQFLVLLEMLLLIASGIIITFEFLFIFKPKLSQLSKKNEELETTIQGVSESKRQMFEAFQRFDLSIDAIDAGIWEWFIKDNTEWWSEKFYAVLGYSNNEIKAQYSVFINDLVHPEDKKSVLDAVDRHLQDRTPFKIEIRLKTKSGEYKWFESTGKASWDEQGNPIRMVGSIIDISERRKAENLLKEQNRKLEEVIDAFSETQKVAKIGVWDVDLATMTANWSDEVYRIHEVPKGKVMKVEDGINYYREDYRDIIQNAVDESISKNTNWDLECVIVTEKGNEVWVRTIGYPKFNDGELIGLRGLFMDIDAEKRKAIKLKEATEKLEMSVITGQVGIWVWDLKTNQLEWNDQMYQIMGVTNFDFNGSYEDFAKRVHPDDLSKLELEVGNTLEGNGAFYTEFRVICSSGEIRYLNGRGDVIRDEEGVPIRMIGTNLDITERMDMLERLKAKQAQLRVFVEQAPVAVAMFDTEMNYITVSNMWYSDYDIVGKNIIGKCHYDIFPEIKENSEWLAMHRSVLKGREITNLKDKFVRDDGSVQWISWKLIPWYDEPGSIGGMIMYTSDITDQVEYEEKLKNLNEVLEEKVTERTEALNLAIHELESFSYSISHDLRAPLRSVNGFADILKEDYGEELDEEANRIIDIIKNSGLKMGELIDDILAFSRLGRKELSKSNIDMSKLFEEVKDEVSNEYKNHEAEVTIENLHNTAGDISLLRQVVVNLLSNAFKYSAENETIRIKISSELKRNQIIYSVSDNGVGFDMKYHDKLFGVFQRLHSNNQFEGTGVGLAIVKRIVEKHGGEIWAESIINNGSTFYFSLPKA